MLKSDIVQNSFKDCGSEKHGASAGPLCPQKHSLATTLPPLLTNFMRVFMHGNIFVDVCVCSCESVRECFSVILSAGHCMVVCEVTDM